MDALINYLLLFGDLNEQQVDFIASKCVEHKIKRDEFYQEAGKTPKEVAFLVKGVFRVSYFNNKGDDITKYFLDENHFVVDLDSYNQKKPSPEYTGHDRLHLHHLIAGSNGRVIDDDSSLG
jgi:CRP-like cAMP-binding protein